MEPIIEGLYLFVTVIAVFILRQFVISKNGELRKIMIAYFSIEIFIYGSALVYFWLSENGYKVIPLHFFRIILIVPKALIKIWLLKYLLKNSQK